MTIADELKKLADLRDAGALTAEEFDAAKKKLLAADAPAPGPHREDEKPLELDSDRPPEPDTPKRSPRSGGPAPPAGSPWKGIDDSPPDENEDEEREVVRYRPRRARSGTIMVALSIISVLSLIYCLLVYVQSSARDSNILNGATLYPVLSHSTLIAVSLVATVVFTGLVVLAWRQPFISGCIGLALYLVLGITSTVLGFQGVEKAFEEYETGGSIIARDSDDDRFRRLSDRQKETVYEKLYFRYGLGWAVRTPLVILLIIGIADTWPRWRRVV